MYLVKQHLPNFFDPRDPREEAQVESLEEMFKLPWISLWATPKLKRFSQSDNRKLMAEMTDGTWWVIAYIPKELASQLPKWKPK